MLEYSIEEIKKEEQWHNDPDYMEAVEDNWKVLLRLCQEMKEKILKLYDLKFQPSDSKTEELLSIDRIDSR